MKQKTDDELMRYRWLCFGSRWLDSSPFTEAELAAAKRIVERWKEKIA